MKFRLFILLTILVTNVYAQTYSSIISDDEINSFLTVVIKNSNEQHKKSLFNYRISRWDSSHFYKPDTIKFKTERGIELSSNYYMNYLFRDDSRERIDTIINSNDHEFLRKQFHSIKDTLWRSDFNHYKLFRKKKQKEYSVSYSIPLFSIDRETAIIKTSYWCGSLCGSGGIEIYQKDKNGKWRFIVRIHSWVS